jgi:hypothetical protein
LCSGRDASLAKRSGTWQLGTVTRQSDTHAQRHAASALAGSPKGPRSGGLQPFQSRQLMAVLRQKMTTENVRVRNKI